MEFEDEVNEIVAAGMGPMDAARAAAELSELGIQMQELGRKIVDIFDNIGAIAGLAVNVSLSLRQMLWLTRWTERVTYNAAYHQTLKYKTTDERGVVFRRLRQAWRAVKA